MPCKLRLEYPGAICRVIDRGNFRADMFRSDGVKEAFEACVFEACTRCACLFQAWEIVIQLRPPPGAGWPDQSDVWEN